LGNLSSYEAIIKDLSNQKTLLITERDINQEFFKEKVLKSENELTKALKNRREAQIVN
jgi:hypothetical protein